MQFNLREAVQILERTPSILKSLLTGLSYDLLKNNEGVDTWSAYDVIGHLIYGEETDWLVRTKIIMSDAKNKTFEPFDRFAQMSQDQSKDITILLDLFVKLRAQNINELKAMDLTENDLGLTGIHPELGEVTLKQLLSAWVVHDLGHIVQISRVMAKQYTDEVGPWTAYLAVLGKQA